MCILVEVCSFHLVDDGIFLGKAEDKLSNILKVTQIAGLVIKRQKHQFMSVSTYECMKIAPMDSHNMH